MKILSILLTGLLFTFSLGAQTVIKGTISDENKQALTGANIYLKGTYDGTTSDINGHFNLDSDESGDHLLCIEFLGFESKEIPVNLNSKALSINTTLKEAFNELTAVTISAGTFEAGDKMKSVKVNSIDMVTTAGSSGNLYGALQSLPGTTTVGESGKLFVKGGDSREAKTFIDGTLAHSPYSESAPNTAVRGRFSPFMFSGTMFSTGGYSAEYGQALSSVLDLNTMEQSHEDQLNISVLSVGAELGGTKSWDKGSVTATGSYNNLKPYMSLVPQNTQWANEPQSLNGEANIRLKTPKSGLFKAYTNLSQSKFATNEIDLMNPGNTYTYNLTNNNLYFNSSWRGALSNKSTLYAGVSHTTNSNQVHLDTMNYNEQLQGTHGKVTIKHKISKQIKLAAGGEWQHTGYGVRLNQTEQQHYNKFNSHLLSAFSETEWHVNNLFVNRIGIRIEHDTYLNKSNIAPRLSSAYKLNEKNQISLSYGWFYQNPENEFLLYTSSLDFEKADHYTLNFIHHSKGRTLRTELYYKDYSSLIKYDINTQNNYEFLNNSGYGHASGLDLLWRDRESIKNMEYWVSYSYINTSRNYLNFPEESAPNFASKHNLNLILKYWLSPLRSLIGVSYRYASPRVYNNPNSEVFNGEQTTAYRSLDANWSYLHRQNVIFHFSATNILGFNQQFGHRYASNPNEQGQYNSTAIIPGAKRFFVIGCFITLSKSNNANQMDQIN